VKLRVHCTVGIMISLESFDRALKQYLSAKNVKDCILFRATHRMRSRRNRTQAGHLCHEKKEVIL